ncbi:MAG: hypothetical protein QOD82_1196, partial [Pseudonocardiales bacterium]|nr:hypothetical protein [Pseudonocardiales bacterium]
MARTEGCAAASYAASAAPRSARCSTIAALSATASSMAILVPE